MSSLKKVENCYSIFMEVKTLIEKWAEIMIYWINNLKNVDLAQECKKNLGKRDLN